MPFSKRRKGKQGGPAVVAAATVPPAAESTPAKPASSAGDDMILTHPKRRGIYECDYCRTDISQLPRIRCAVCPDFDLCLDCFATTDHKAAIARMKAATTAQNALDDSPAAWAPGVSSAAASHDDTHGYRVCDSTRYPLFPANRNVALQLSARVPDSDLDDKFSEQSRGGMSETEADAAVSMDGDHNPSEMSVEEDARTDSSKKEAETKQHEKQETPLETKGSEKDQASENETAPRSAQEDQQGMEDNKPETPKKKEAEAVSTTEASATSDVFLVQEDAKNVWTVEEDLRLLDGILTHGLGNWADISEAVSGDGSLGKTPKRCMERYFDDFLGRYGHILPPYTMIRDDEEEKEGVDQDKDPEDGIRSSKRRRLTRSPSGSLLGGPPRKMNFKVVPTESLPGFDQVWPEPYLPDKPGIQMGQEVGRDQIFKAEGIFVKTIAAASDQQEAEAIRKEWEETRLNQPGGPTVLPMRPEDVAALPGAELAGYMPRRGDFDIEWENDAEQAIADMEFSSVDLPQERALKLQVIEIYNSKLDERERRKEFLLNRNLYDYRKNHAANQQLPRDERDLILRMRLFERFHTPEEHEKFVADLLKAKRLRKEIAKLQMYRRMGIRTLFEMERYELDKNRRNFHKTAHLKEAEARKNEATATAASTDRAAGANSQTQDANSSLWKQYRTSDRKARRSINRTDGGDGLEAKVEGENAEAPSKQERDAEDTTEPADMDTDIRDKKEESKEEPDQPMPDAESGDGTFNIVGASGFDLLSPKEAELCTRLRLLPSQYLEIKKALIHESLMKGLLDKEGPGSARRTIVKIDIEKRGDVIDFLVRAGWISNKLGATARRLPPATVVE